MEAQGQFFTTLTTLAGFLFVFIILLILFLEFRDLVLCKRIRAKVTRIVELPGTDDDGIERINRFPEIEFIDTQGKTILHQLAITNITWRKPGDSIWIYYRLADNKAGYKICAPFMWPKLILLCLLIFCAFMLLFGPHT